MQFVAIAIVEREVGLLEGVGAVGVGVGVYVYECTEDVRLGRLRLSADGKQGWQNQRPEAKPG